jgi:hypothetical protein
MIRNFSKDFNCSSVWQSGALILSSAPHWLSGSSRIAVYRQNVPRFIVILFLDKMVNTILSCEYFAGRWWRREMYGLRF